MASPGCRPLLGRSFVCPDPLSHVGSTASEPESRWSRIDDMDPTPTPEPARAAGRGHRRLPDAARDRLDRAAHPVAHPLDRVDASGRPTPGSASCTWPMPSRTRPGRSGAAHSPSASAGASSWVARCSSTASASSSLGLAPSWSAVRHRRAGRRRRCRVPGRRGQRARPRRLSRGSRPGDEPPPRVVQRRRPRRAGHDRGARRQRRRRGRPSRSARARSCRCSPSRMRSCRCRAGDGPSPIVTRT